ncbi:MAG: hypothetical protein ACPLQO_04175 [Desulfotomaculales bacterium]
MRRMQVVVEEWQYEFLRKMAESQGKSISAVLRQIISGRMEKNFARAKDPLLGAAGIAQASPGNDFSSETIDRRLYRV